MQNVSYLNSKSSQNTHLTVPSLIVLLSLAAIVLTSPSAAHAQTTSQLTITTQDTDGNPVYGYYTVLNYSGHIEATGFTTATFTLTDGDTYSVQVDNYGACSFDHWLDTGSTSYSRTVSITSDTQYTAVMNCGGTGGASSLTVSSTDQTGTSISGYYTVLYTSGGDVVSTGFTPTTFATTAGQSYSVQVDNYGSCAFAHWSDGVTSNPRALTVSGSSQSLTAVYNCATTSGISLVQAAGATCSYVCSSGAATATFMSSVTAGHMLLVSVVSDDLTTLHASDTLGTSLMLASSATSTSCISPSNSCQADLYWGILTSSGSDSVSVSQGGSDVALRVQAWEFSGVSAIGNTASCEPTCPSTSYPAGSVLFATGRDTSGAGPGFSFVPYVASSIAGSEYQVVASAGSTTFPFSNPVDDAEAAVVLVSSGTSTINISTVNSANSPISGYYITIWQGGVQEQSCFTSCSFTVNDGQTYQVEAASYGSETFSHWQDGSTGLETVVIPSASTTIALTATYTP